MIDNPFSLVFRCRHSRLTRPVTPAFKPGEPQGQTYVVCLDCAKRFSYDITKMKMGKALPAAPASGFIPPPPKSRMKRNLLLTIPVGVAIGALLKIAFKKNKPS
jgi:hypothetical protein